MTLHTAPGCSVDNATTAADGKLIQAYCNAGSGSNGCTITTPPSISVGGQEMNTAGAAFNDQNGAIIVAEWTDSSINVWMFNRVTVLASVNAYSPDTAGFPQPLAHFSEPGSDVSRSFREMQIIIDIDVCGDRAGVV